MSEQSSKKAIKCSTCGQNDKCITEGEDLEKKCMHLEWLITETNDRFLGISANLMLQQYMVLHSLSL